MVETVRLAMAQVAIVHVVALEVVISCVVIAGGDGACGESGDGGGRDCRW